MQGSCDAVVVASAIDPAIQRERVLCRPGMTPEKLEHILEKQVPDESKRSMADYVINTSDPSMSPLRNQV
jgi:dephospho-CoA kinase